MKGLDTNVLVRYLTQDDPVQSRKANALIAEAVDRGEQCPINVIVLCELVWVLRDLSPRQAHRRRHPREGAGHRAARRRAGGSRATSARRLSPWPWRFRGLPHRLAEPSGRLLGHGDVPPRAREERALPGPVSRRARRRVTGCHWITRSARAQNVRRVLALVHRACVLENGRLTLAGPAQAVLADDRPRSPGLSGAAARVRASPGARDLHHQVAGGGPPGRAMTSSSETGEKSM